MFAYAYAWSMNLPREKRIITSVRPARVAVFVRDDDPHWQATCARIIEFFSATGGGGYNIIVPMDANGTTIRSVFWDILDIYDSDFLFSYYYSGDDIRQNDPERYEQLLDDHLQRFIRGGPVSDVDSAREQINEQLRNVPQFEEPHAELQQKLLKNAGAFSHSQTRI
jgi:hypothetical protein